MNEQSQRMNSTAARGYAPPDVDEAYRLYADMVYRIAVLRTRSASDAEDVTQEVFLRYIRRKPELANEEHCRAWFIRVTLNCTNSLLGSLWRARSVPEEELEKLGMTADEPEYEVYSAVLSLPEAYRTVVHLHYYEDLRVSDVARLLRLRENTVKSRLLRARAMLRERLKEDYDVQ